MQLDWFTISAQVVNFLILVALLKRFLYGPIIQAMDQREAHIASRLQEAQEGITQAEQKAALYERQINELHNTREQLLTQARQDAEVQHRDLLEQARQEVQRLRERWHEALRHEQDAFLRGLREHAGVQVCAVARRALTDLAHEELEHRMIDVFLERLQDLAAETRHTLAEAARSDAQGLVIRTALPLSSERRQQLCAAVQTHIADGADVQFASRPELLCGIELEASGCKVAWNLAEYLDTLEAHFATVLAAETSEPDITTVS
jgi:F-type H+-transporting ATPase subunit b